jgi:hypothetical protein
LTLNLTLHSTAFREAVRRHIEEKAKITGEAVSAVHGGRQVAALRGLAELIGATSSEDQHMVILHATAKATGRYSDAKAKFEPSPRQKTLLARIGQLQDTPSASVSLEELCSGGVADWVDLQGQRNSETSARLQEAAEQIRELEARVADLDEKAKGRADAERKLASAEHERDHANKLVDELRERLGAREPDEKPDKPRRVSLQKETGDPRHIGIYFSEIDGERIYEIGYADEDGRRRWKTIGPDLEEAIALRRELTEQKEEVAA